MFWEVIEVGGETGGKRRGIARYPTSGTPWRPVSMDRSGSGGFGWIRAEVGEISTSCRLHPASFLAVALQRHLRTHNRRTVPMPAAGSAIGSSQSGAANRRNSRIANSNPYSMPLSPAMRALLACGAARGESVRASTASAGADGIRGRHDRCRGHGCHGGTNGEVQSGASAEGAYRCRDGVPGPWPAPDSRPRMLPCISAAFGLQNPKEQAMLDKCARCAACRATGSEAKR